VASVFSVPSVILTKSVGHLSPAGAYSSHIWRYYTHVAPLVLKNGLNQDLQINGMNALWHSPGL